MVKAKYTIKRPPLLSSFELPSREELLAIKEGDFVKLVFAADELGGERMWVKVMDSSDPYLWIGELANEPIDNARLKQGDTIHFSPLDVIAWQI